MSGFTLNIGDQNTKCNPRTKMCLFALFRDASSHITMATIVELNLMLHPIHDTFRYDNYDSLPQLYNTHC